MGGGSRVAMFAVALALLLGVSAVPGASKAAAYHAPFCTGKTVKPSVPCNGVIHNWVTGIYVSGVEHSVCVDDFLRQKDPRCTAGPGQGVYLDLTPSENATYGIIFPNTGVKGDTTVSGTIFWRDPDPSPPPPPPPPPPSWHGPIGLGGGVVEDPDVASWGPGRLDVFARGTNDFLH